MSRLEDLQPNACRPRHFCRTQYKPASQVLRESMRDNVAEHSKNIGRPRRKRGAA